MFPCAQCRRWVDTTPVPGTSPLEQGTALQFVQGRFVLDTVAKGVLQVGSIFSDEQVISRLDRTMPDTFTLTRRRVATVAASTVLLLGASACGGGADESTALAESPTPSETPATVAPVTVATTAVPETTVAPTTTVMIESTDELSAFAVEHAALVIDWSAQLEAFGAEAMDYLDDVSTAPASPDVLSLSGQVIDAVGVDATDPGLVTIRDFAAGMAEALELSADGDQTSALTTFLELQGQSEQLTSAVTLVAT